MLLTLLLQSLLVPLAFCATLPVSENFRALAANLHVTCDYRLGAGLEARSCFDALSSAPRGLQQEVWLPINAPAPAPPGTVISPTMVVSSKLDLQRNGRLRVSHCSLLGRTFMYGGSSIINVSCRRY